MIISLLFASVVSLMPIKHDAITTVAAGKDTVWWRSDVGNVTGHRGDDATTCSLWLIDQNGSVAFTWEKDKPIVVSAITSTLGTADATTHLQVNLQIGDEVVTEQPVDAIGFGTTISFFITDAVEDRLRTASRIIISSTTKAKYLMYLNRSKMDALVSHVKQCRDSVPGWGDKK